MMPIRSIFFVRECVSREAAQIQILEDDLAIIVTHSLGDFSEDLVTMAEDFASRTFGPREQMSILLAPELEIENERIDSRSPVVPLAHGRVAGEQIQFISEPFLAPSAPRDTHRFRFRGIER